MARNYPCIYLIRHGETEWSLTGQHTGRSDIPLTRNGEEEALRLRARLEREHPDILEKAARVSPLQRARKTAELLGFAQMVVDPEIQEWNYGKYEGLRTPEIRQTQPGWSVYRDGCPGGENLAQVEARAQSVIESIRKQESDSVLVAHGHFLCVFAGCWLGLGGIGGKRFQLGTASLSILSYHHGLDDPVVLLWNERQ